MAYAFFLTSVGAPIGPGPEPPVTLDIYGTVAGANAYFDSRLHEEAWTNSTAEDRPKALWAATLIIDALNYKGLKNSVYNLLEEDELASDQEIREAETTQTREFPRDEDTEVPEEILVACYEIAYELLNGKNPDLELENLGVVSQGFGPARTSYGRNQTLVEHIIHGVPSMMAWEWLKPFLRDAVAVTLSRVD